MNVQNVIINIFQPIKVFCFLCMLIEQEKLNVLIVIKKLDIKKL